MPNMWWKQKTKVVFKWKKNEEVEKTKEKKYWSNKKVETKHEEVEKTKEKDIDQMKRVETKKKKIKFENHETWLQN
jgi:hypothetical protein